MHVKNSPPTTIFPLTNWTRDRAIKILRRDKYKPSMTRLEMKLHPLKSQRLNFLCVVTTNSDTSGL